MKRACSSIFKRIRRIDLKELMAFLSFIVISLTLYFAVTPLKGESDLYSDIIRFHVLANSNSEHDQILKLKVRDRVTEYTSSLLKECKSIDRAKEIISKNGDIISEIARECIAEEGYSYDITLSEGFEVYPERTYGDLTFPAGRYYSVRIGIGSAGGRNWWCVMFPPLCVSGAVEEKFQSEQELLSVGFTEDEVRLISDNSDGRREIRFYFLDLINKMK